jgi:hypothetical protein
MSEVSLLCHLFQQIDSYAHNYQDVCFDLLAKNVKGLLPDPRTQLIFFLERYHYNTIFLLHSCENLNYAEETVGLIPEITAQMFS